MFPNHDGQASDQRLSHEALYARYDAHTDEVSSGSSDQGILAQPSTLSFVFETGSGTRNGGRSVRSQAAKHGWSSRQRAAPNRQDGKRKRRKVKPGPISEGAPSQQSDAIHGFIVHTLFEDTPTLPSSYSDKGGLDPLSLPPDSSIVSEILNGLGLSNLPVPPPSTPREMRPLQPYALVARDNLSKCLPALATSTPSFLQAVLNVECPLYSRIDSIGSPFEGLPVVWDPLYTVLATRCMYIYLDTRFMHTNFSRPRNRDSAGSADKLKLYTYSAHVRYTSSDRDSREGACFVLRHHESRSHEAQTRRCTLEEVSRMVSEKDR